jgi:hypothetical protein
MIPNTDTAGYRLYVGTASNSYTQRIEAANSTRVTVLLRGHGLQRGSSGKSAFKRGLFHSSLACIAHKSQDL